MQLTSGRRLDDGVLERGFRLGEIPGTLWTAGSGPAPLILMAHNNGPPKDDPRLAARARYHAAGHGYAVASIDAAGCGDRVRTAADELARADLRRAARSGEPLDEALESLVGPLVDGAVPDWRTTLDVLLAASRSPSSADCRRPASVSAPNASAAPCRARWRCRVATVMPSRS